jgi:copper chaperone NosL
MFSLTRRGCDVHRKKQTTLPVMRAMMKGLFSFWPLTGLPGMARSCLIVSFIAVLAVACNEKEHTGYMGDGPEPATAALDAEGKMIISQQDRCAACAMVAARSEKFASAIELTDGKAFYFCSTGCMIRSWMHPEVCLNVDKKLLLRSVVRDYFTGEYMDGGKVIWVAGSDVVGPMGPALVPLKTEQDVSAFKRRHGAKVTFRLSEMTDELWGQITGEEAVR